ncbi:MAG: sigma-70 family RNA polymerase sigma factor [Planctomycetes bacterium]|nr:sigma-70 family RNA polymerase sigma factor [Planctomycetota bacterium]
MPAANDTTRRWANQALAGSREARDRLCECLVEPLRAFLVGSRLGLTPSELNDALQETFLRLFERLDRLEQAEAPTSYALGVARHVALDRLRNRERAKPLQGPALERVADPTDVVAAVAGHEQAALVRETLDALDPEQRAVLTLRHINGLTMSQLASCLECSVPTARSRLRSASRALAGALLQRGVWPREGK